MQQKIKIKSLKISPVGCSISIKSPDIVCFYSGLITKMNGLEMYPWYGLSYNMTLNGVPV